MKIHVATLRYGKNVDSFDIIVADSEFSLKTKVITYYHDISHKSPIPLIETWKNIANRFDDQGWSLAIKETTL